MKGFKIFEDKHGEIRVLKYTEPIIIGTIIPAYNTGNRTLISKTITIEDQSYRLALDESFNDITPSKINYILNKGIGFFKHFKSQKIGNE